MLKESINLISILSVFIKLVKMIENSVNGKGQVLDREYGNVELLLWQNFRKRLSDLPTYSDQKGSIDTAQ